MEQENTPTPAEVLDQDREKLKELTSRFKAATKRGEESWLECAECVYEAFELGLAEDDKMEWATKTVGVKRDQVYRYLRIHRFFVVLKELPRSYLSQIGNYKLDRIQSLFNDDGTPVRTGLADACWFENGKIKLKVNGRNCNAENASRQKVEQVVRLYRPARTENTNRSSRTQDLEANSGTTENTSHGNEQRVEQAPDTGFERTDALDANVDAHEESGSHGEIVLTDVRAALDVHSGGADNAAPEAPENSASKELGTSNASMLSDTSNSAECQGCKKFARRLLELRSKVDNEDVQLKVAAMENVELRTKAYDLEQDLAKAHEELERLRQDYEELEYQHDELKRYLENLSHESAMAGVADSDDYGTLQFD